MKLLTVAELQALLAPQPEPCISVFLPTHRHLPGSAQNPIRFKNLLRSAEGLLSERYGARDIGSLLGPLQKLTDSEFWRYQMDGLALFRSSEMTVSYRLPMALPELAVVADTFHVKPLLRFLQTNRRFYVLSLSQKAVSLYDGTAHSLGPVDLTGLPKSLTDALGLEKGERMLNPQSAEKTGKAPVFRGPGAPEAATKDDLLRFFRAIDQALWEKLRDEKVPLVFAGPGYYFPLYRDICRYPNLAPEAVEGSFDNASPEELHAKAWPVVQKLFDQIEKHALQEFEKLQGRKQAIDVLTDVVKAAFQGRVRRLLIGDGKPLFGRIDPVSLEVTLSVRQEGPKEDDVLDDLAEAVLARGGEVFFVPQARMPGEAAAAAILRW